MDSMTEEELAEYRAAMAEFLQKQGLSGVEKAATRSATSRTQNPRISKTLPIS